MQNERVFLQEKEAKNGNKAFTLPTEKPLAPQSFPAPDFIS